MKKYGVCIGVVLISFSCFGQSSELVIKTDADSLEVRYWPLDGEHLPYYDLYPVKVVTSQQPEKISFSDKDTYYRIIAGNKSFKVYTTPGSKDTIYISNDNPSFKGSNESYNLFLADREASDTYCRDYIFGWNHELEKIKELPEYLQEIEKRKQNDLKLPEGKKLKKEFVEQQQFFTDVRYKAVFLSKILSLYNSSELTEEWIEELKNSSLPVQNELFRQSPFFYRMLDDYAAINNFVLGDRTPEDIMNTNAVKTFLAKNYSDLLQGKNLEHAIAYLIYADIFQNDYSAEIPGLYDKFASLYPNSSYMEVLTPGVNKIREFYNQSISNPDILFVDYETIPVSFDEIVKPFAGKVIYLDVWATWCSPCLRMFSHLDELKEKIRDVEEVVCLYISIDKDNNHEKWEKMIPYYKLTGSHYRVNDQNSQVIYDTLGTNGSLSIPLYVIIDKNGKIVFRNAPSPEDPDEVIRQIKTILN